MGEVEPLPDPPPPRPNCVPQLALSKPPRPSALDKRSGPSISVAPFELISYFDLCGLLQSPAKLAGFLRAPDRPLLIAESIETTLSAMQLFDLPGWSAVSAGGLKALPLPAEERSIVIAADNDASGAGQRNALAAYERWSGEGRAVQIKIPPKVGDDFNDVLIGRGR